MLDQLERIRDCTAAALQVVISVHEAAAGPVVTATEEQWVALYAATAAAQALWADAQLRRHLDRPEVVYLDAGNLAGTTERAAGSCYTDLGIRVAAALWEAIQREVSAAGWRQALGARWRADEPRGPGAARRTPGPRRRRVCRRGGPVAG